MGFTEIISTLDSISRTRALTEEESLRLERAIDCERNAHQRDRKRGFQARRNYWTAQEDETAKRMFAEGKTTGQIARNMNRTVNGVYHRLKSLGAL